MRDGKPKFEPKTEVSLEVQRDKKQWSNIYKKKGLNAICLNVNIPREETDGRLLKIDIGIDGQMFQGIIDSGAEVGGTGRIYTVMWKGILETRNRESCRCKACFRSANSSGRR